MPYHDQIGDARFRAQFRLMREGFARRESPVEIEVEPYAERDVHFVYAADRILVRGDDDAGRVRGLVPGLAPVENQPRAGLTVLRSREVPVPEALTRIDAALGAGVATPDHVLYVCPVLMCPAVEPDVPGCGDERVEPCPRQTGDAGAGNGVLVGVSDTGLLPDADQAFPWLSGVTGAPDTLPPMVGGVQPIPPYAGHGTFIAGVLRCMAPAADVVVADHFPTAGAAALLESEIVDQLIGLLARKVRIISLSAGATTRLNLPLLSFEVFWDDHLSRRPEVLLVAAAGNDGTDREFWPAAFPWALSVGALAADQQHRAWFSNFSNPANDWVRVYAPGEGLVNAYASGEYTYSEPPRTGSVQAFSGMARWSGTSFATPLVAGLVAEWMGRNTGANAADAVAAVAAAAQPLPGVGPAVFPGQVL